MTQDILIEKKGKIGFIILNRPDKANAFDDRMLLGLEHQLQNIEADHEIRVVILKANGKHFSAGADLNWMQRMVHYTEDENESDAMVLARVLYSLYTCSKPTIAMVQGSVYGGGIGLIAACDLAIAASDSNFCFSETAIGLIPAVICPYIIKAIGPRATKWLFMSAKKFDSKLAQNLNLIQYVTESKNLNAEAIKLAERFLELAPNAVSASKELVNEVADRPIDEELLTYTVKQIAAVRVSHEGQQGLKSFLKGIKPQWGTKDAL